MAGAASRAHKNEMRGKLPEKVFKKAAHLQKAEGMSRKEALGAAAGMNRSGRLTESGKYIRKK